MRLKLGHQIRLWVSTVRPQIKTPVRITQGCMESKESRPIRGLVSRHRRDMIASFPVDIRRCKLKVDQTADTSALTCSTVARSVSSSSRSLDGIDLSAVTLCIAACKSAAECSSAPEAAAMTLHPRADSDTGSPLTTTDRLSRF